ncbi:MAG: hypothetical protein MJZ88_01850 [Paludibacteraceae bacterium]|nr:hypothetical protein [Paludibacteraceae bacterium]
MLNQGDPPYQASLYNHTDIFFYLVRRSFVKCYAGWSFLVTNSGTSAISRSCVVNLT